MLHLSSRWGYFAGQNDVQPTLHVPVVYENTAVGPQKWEYLVLNIDSREEALPDQARLSELGAQGWLLVGVLPQENAKGGQVYYYFARQKDE